MADEAEQFRVRARIRNGPVACPVALRRRHRYATVLIDAETRERIDVLPGRTADTRDAQVRAHPEVQVVCG